MAAAAAQGALLWALPWMCRLFWFRPCCTDALEHAAPNQATLQRLSRLRYRASPVGPATLC